MGRLDDLQLLGHPDVLPAQAGAEDEGGYGEADAEVHDVADSLSVALERGGEPVALHDLPDRVGARADDKIRVHANLTNPPLELLAQAVVEDGVGGHEPGGGAYALTEKGDGHGDGDLGCGDEVLDRHVRLINNEDEVSERSTDFRRLQLVIDTVMAK